jgi:uridylate kinase
MNTKQRILCKLTGEIFLDSNKSLSATMINHVIEQIVILRNSYQFGIVIGGGNFFRGNQQGKKLGISASVGHQVGMLATMMNGLIIKDLLELHGVSTSLFCAMPSPEVGKQISQQSIDTALQSDQTLVFSGGTGNPYFTTDTNAILRALQIDAAQVWKGTHVDGVYNADPKKDPQATLLKSISYDAALQHKLGIMDATAFALAQQYQQKVRIFNIFEPNALIKAAQDPDFGSIIY